ncbi:MAG: UDP-3-O-(3-hydroxymyristoyl)glucosamine N-acyltransferase [SAR86 cluster bacterium]|nr:UDP-3-O-(3-hydroxymyristoyl)glucosamine N-acyltransferase [SAR86 cluster bacterium]MDG2092778.1 UDP-3-O-(3-hydroxymyristoyl)glucosamine N-acyltransferase [SAR86 cluster bacterium]
MTSSKSYSLLELSKLLETTLIGDGNAIVDNLKTIQDANDSSLSFVANQKYSKYLSSSKALAFIVHPNTIDGIDEGNYLVTDDPYLAFAKASSLFSSNLIKQNIGSVHPTATVFPETNLGKNVVIGPNVYIGPNCSIGDFSSIRANSSLVSDVQVGSNTHVHNGAVLGSDGFGYAPSKDGYIKIEQLGSLIIGSDVEIGAGCTIDRGALGDTHINDGVKLDNQVHIAHNVELGSHSAIAACCAIAGSTVIGKNFKMGGLSGVLGHLNIADNVTVGAHTLITKSIKESGEYIGIMPAQKPKDWAKSSIFIKRRK